MAESFLSHTEATPSPDTKFATCRSWISSLQNCGKISACCLSYTIRVLQQGKPSFYETRLQNQLRCQAVCSSRTTAPP
jgi:hypothetical protein